MVNTDSHRHVFVYGTLRRGEANDINRLQPSPRFVGTARLQGEMYRLGRYPGVILGGADWVVGEVYAITPELERQLDIIEEVYPQQTDEYVKREVVVPVEGEMLMCLVYEINPRYTQGLPRIAMGDWVRGR